MHHPDTLQQGASQNLVSMVGLFIKCLGHNGGKINPFLHQLPGNFHGPGRDAAVLKHAGIVNDGSVQAFRRLFSHLFRIQQFVQYLSRRTGSAVNVIDVGKSGIADMMINADRLPEKVMSFRTQVNGYGSTTSKFEVYVLTSNDPETAEKTQLNPVLAEAPASGYSDWVNSGNLDLSGFTGKIYIGFRYAAENDANYATWCFDDVKVGVKGEGGAVSGNDGSESKPYTVDDVLNGATGNGVWVSGYIVGFSSGTDASTTAKFTAEGANNLNLLLAVSADVKDASQCIAVSLPNGDVRTSLNLRDNPGNLGQAVSVKGDIAENYKIPGVKNTTDFKF